MNAVFRPVGRAALNTSTAHSAVISGSLYEDPTIRAPWRTARPTSSSGVTSRGMTPAGLSPRARAGSQVLPYPHREAQAPRAANAAGLASDATPDQPLGPH